MVFLSSTEVYCRWWCTESCLEGFWRLCFWRMEVWLSGIGRGVTARSVWRGRRERRMERGESFLYSIKLDNFRTLNLGVSPQPEMKKEKSCTRVRIFFHALLSALDVTKNDDYTAFFALYVVYAIFENKGTRERIVTWWYEIFLCSCSAEGCELKDVVKVFDLCVVLWNVGIEELRVDG